MSDLALTPEMIDGIEKLAKRLEVKPETVLRRAVFSYLAKLNGEVGMLDTTNVVPLRTE